MSKTIFVAVSDLHCNSTVGLCPPKFRLDDGGEYTSSPAQSAVWRAWRGLWNIVADLKEELAADVVTVLAGDTVDRNKHSAHQLVSANKASAVSLAALALAPMTRVSDRLCIIRGTAAHVGRGGSLEEQLAREFDDDFLIRDSATGNKTWWHWYPKIEGVTFDITHHPTTASRLPWGRGPAAGRMSARMHMEYLEAGLPIPDIAIRGHVHCTASSGRFSKPETFILPPWELTSHFGHRLGGGGPVEPVGGLIFVLEDGRYDVVLKTWKAVTRKIWNSVK